MLLNMAFCLQAKRLQALSSLRAKSASGTIPPAGLVSAVHRLLPVLLVEKHASLRGSISEVSRRNRILFCCISFPFHAEDVYLT